MVSNITHTIGQSTTLYTPLMECLRRFSYNPVLISQVPDIERPCVIVLASRGWLRAWRDEADRFGYEITESGFQALER